jgi:uncharacterized protein YndB with AHSA1/START domain
MSEPFTESIELAVPVSRVWEALTTPAELRRWLADPEMQVEVVTDWTVGGPIEIRGFLYARFVNDGVVVRFEPQARLTYTHRSSLSRLPAAPESYATLDFALAARGEGASLSITISGFPDEIIEKHLRFYWRMTLPALKRFLERGSRDG